jgi:opine dehydrogenase
MTIPQNELRIAVLGAGHGGRAMAADLAARGYHINLYNRTFEHIETIHARGGIELQLEEEQRVFGELQVVTSRVEEAVAGARLVMIVVPASAHEDMACRCAPHLVDGQIVVLNPGRTGGALEFRRVLSEQGCTADVVIAEAGTLLFASRATGPAEARMFRRKNTVPLATLPATRIDEALDIVQEVYPQFVGAPNVLHTSFNNMGAVFHPVLTLLNAGWIERTQGDFQFYMDGVTPSTAHVLEVIDRERSAYAPRPRSNGWRRPTPRRARISTRRCTTIPAIRASARRARCATATFSRMCPTASCPSPNLGGGSASTCGPSTR